MGLPEWWLAIVAFLVAHAADAPLGAVSVFEGCGSLSRALNDYHIPALGFEILRDPIYEDLLAMEGIQNLLMMVVRVCVHGVVWLGPPCCSWIWMTRSKSRRSREHPEGNEMDPWVAMHNQIALFVSRIALTCHMRKSSSNPCQVCSSTTCPLRPPLLKQVPAR